MKLALGTAQFGLSYGVSNRAGQVKVETIRHILDYAKLHKINTLDTAVSYGESEKQLGLAGVQGWQVISKLPQIPAERLDIDLWVFENVKSTLRKLGVPKLRGLLLHRPEQLLQDRGPKLYRALKKARSEGLVEKIGISIYSPAELEAILPRYPIDLVQAPFNIMDQRLIGTGWLNRLPEMGVELHVRSIFLQGLLIMSIFDRPKKFQRWNSLWQQWTSWLESTRQTPVQACMRFAMSFPQIGKIIVGIEDAKQLDELIEASKSELVDRSAFDIPESAILLNPARWCELD